MTPEPKNTLAIRLTEPVIFLRSSDPSGRHQPESSDPPALVRGLLTLNVAKPTRISSIEVELAGVATTSWPEGVGTRRMDVMEEHKVYSAKATFFCASQLPCARRTASVGPGLSLVDDHDHEDSAEPSALRTQSQTRGQSPQRRTRTEDSANASTNSTRMVRGVSCDAASFARMGVGVGTSPDLGPTPPYTPRSTIVTPPRPALRSSPSGSALAGSPAQTLEDLRQALRDNLDGSEVTPGQRPTPLFLPTTNTTHSSTSSISNVSAYAPQDHASEESSYRQETSLPRQPSSDEVGAHTPTHTLSPSRLASSSPDAHSMDRDASVTRIGQRDSSTPRTGRAHSRFSFGAVLDVVKEVTRTRSRSKDVQGEEERGRGRTKVRPNVGADSLGEALDGSATERNRNMTGNGNAHIVTSQALTSPLHAWGHRQHHDKDHTHSLLGLGRVLGLDREKAEQQGQKEQGDGWKEFKKGTYTYPISFLLPPSLPPTLTHPRGSLTYTLRGVAHRPGTFTSKLTCQTAIHVVAAPSITTGEGGGAGDPGPVVLERQWEDRLAYMLALSSRLLVIGSAGGIRSGHDESVTHRDPHNPDMRNEPDSELDAELQAQMAQGTATLDLSLMPLEKVKIWRIGVYLDERVIYIKSSGKLAWEEGTKRVNLLHIQDACLASDDPSLSIEKEKDGKHKYKPKDEEPIAIPLLPTPISPHRSPLLQYLCPNADPSILAGPGPYTLSATVRLPNCNESAADGKAARVNFTVKNKNANVRVEHQLRVVIRVEKLGDGEGEGDEREHGEGKKKKKAFDIVIQTPVNVLSCRCIPEYQALPRYSEVLQHDTLDQLPCPCDIRGSGARASGASSEEHDYDLNRILSTDSAASSSESVNPSWNGNESPSRRPSNTSHPHFNFHSHSSLQDVNDGSARSPSQSHHRSSLVPHPGPSHGHHPHGHYATHGYMQSQLHPHAHDPSPLTSRPPTPLAQYQRLVSGQETEVGEAPPSYESVTGSG